MLFLPSFTWDVDPVFWRVPRNAVAGTIGAIGLLMVLYGLAKKEREQIITGAFFAGAALLISELMGPLVELRYYSMLFVVVFLGGHALLNWQIKRGGGGPEVAGDFIVYGVLGVLVGARLGHVLFYDLQKAIDDPIWIFKIWTGGLASHGAVAGLIVAMYLFTKSRGIPFLEGSDRFSFSAALGATVVRIGNLFNSEIVGRVVPDQSWGVRFPRNLPDQKLNPIPLRYPSQIYEIALGVGVFVGLLIADRLMGKEKRPRGAMIAWFFALYFTGRLFTEFFKEIEGPLDPDAAISMGQYLSLLPAALGWYGVYWTMKRKEPSGWGDTLPAPDEEDEESDDEEDEESGEDEDEDEDEQAASAPRGRKAPRVAQDEDEDEEHPASTKNSAAVDPDVEAEFEAGKLKKVREEPTE